MSESHDYNALDMSVKGVEDKRAKREIANMNERRRMQNINSGFHSLRALLPHKHDGEKLSKAAILQHTSNYIYQLEQEITKLLSQNSELKRALGGTAMSAVNTNTPEWIKRFASEPPDCPSCKRRKFDDNNRHLDLSPIGPGDGGSSTESSSEQDVTEKSRVRSKQNGSGGGGGKNGAADSEQSLRRQLSRVEKQLEEERRMRRMFEEELGYQNNYQNKSNNNHHNNNNNQLEGRRYSNSNNNNNNNFNNHNNNSSILDPSGMVGDEVEVATESIEIEMHSCPASPPDGMALGALPILTEQVSHSAAANAVYLANQHHSTAGISAPALAAAAEMNHHKLLEQQRAAAKQNAIALPIDVPFVAPSEVVTVDTEEKPTLLTTNENGTPMIAFIDNNGKMHVLGPATMSQTTSNGVTAIGPQGAPMHIEHLNSSATGSNITSNGNVPQSTCILKEENDCCTTSSLPASSMPSNVRCSVITTAISAPIMSTPNEGTASFESANSKASRQNLNTIVEAIRHLEGDHLFNESPNKASRSSPTF